MLPEAAAQASSIDWLAQARTVGLRPPWGGRAVRLCARLALAPGLGCPALHGGRLQNTGSHVSLLSHRPKTEETLLDEKQEKEKGKKAGLTCSWATAPSPFTLGAKSTRRPLCGWYKLLKDQNAFVFFSG